MYLVCCQIVAYILTVYSSPFPDTRDSYLTVTELRLLLWDSSFSSAVWSDCNRFTVQYYIICWACSFYRPDQVKFWHMPRVLNQEVEDLLFSYPVQWWFSVWQVCLNVFRMFPAISSFTHRLSISYLFPRLAWQSSCKYQRQLDLFCSAVDISRP